MATALQDEAALRLLRTLDLSKVPNTPWHPELVRCAVVATDAFLDGFALGAAPMLEKRRSCCTEF